MSMNKILAWLKEKPRDQEKIPALDYGLLLLLGCLFLAVQNLWFPNLPPDQGTIDEVNNSIRHYLAFTHHPGQITPMLTEYQPLAYWVSAIFYRLGGFSIRLAFLSSGIWVFALLFSLYGMGFLLGGRNCAWLAVFLALGNPRTIFWSRLYNLNFSEMAVTGLTFYLLFLTQGFTRKKPALWLGLVLGLAFLTRYAEFYLLLPLLWIFYRLMKQKLETQKSAMFYLLWIGIGGTLFLWGIDRLYAGGGYLFLEKHYLIFQILGFLAAFAIMAWESRSSKSLEPLGYFSLAFFSSLLIYLPWYLGDLGLQYDKIQRHLLHHTFLVPEHGSLLFDYFNTAGHIFPGIALFLLIGLAYALVNFRALNLQLLLIGLIPLVWLLHAGDPNYRYFLPMQVLWILLALCWTYLLPGKLRAALLSLAILWFFLNLAGVAAVESNWGRNWLPLNLAAKAVVNFSGYNHPLLTVLPSGSSDRGLKPVREIPSEGENPLILTLSETMLKSLAGAIAANSKPGIEKELIIAQYNRQPFFVLYKWQLESHLLGLDYFPAKARQDFTPFRLTYLSSGSPKPGEPKPVFLLATLPAGSSFAEAENRAGKQNLSLTLLGEYRIIPARNCFNPNPSAFQARFYLVK